MASPAQIFEQREFRSSSLESQRQRLTDLDPNGFGVMSNADQEAIISEGLKRTNREADYSAALERGLATSLAGAAHLGANLADFAGLDDLEENLREMAQEQGEMGRAPEDQTTGEMYASILGSLPVGLGMAVGATSLAGMGIRGAALMAGASKAAATASAHALAPIVGFGTLGAVGAADRGMSAALKAGAIEGAFGALFPGTQHMGRAARASILGGTAYAISPEEMEFTERAGHGVTMAVMAGIPRSRNPIGMLEKMGAKNSNADFVLDRKMRKEQQLAAELETAGHARDQRAARSEEAIVEPPPRGEAGGKGDPSVESARGRFSGGGEGHPETYKITIEEKDLKTDAQGNRAHSNVKNIEDHPGKNYQYREEVKRKDELPVKLMKHADIFVKIAKVLGLPVRRGRMYQSKGVAGIQYPIQGQGGPRSGEWHDFSGFAKVESYKDVGSAVHEFGHQLSSFKRIQEEMWNSPEARALYATNPKIADMPPWLQELHHISYAAGKAEEGLAELIRHWLSNKQYAMDNAPNATKMFEAIAQKNLTKKQWKALLELQKQVHRWEYQGSLATSLSKIGGDEAKTEDFLHGRMSRAREQGFDDFQGGMELVRILGIEAPDSVYETLRRWRAANAIVDGMRKYGTIKEVPDPKNPGKFKLEYEGKGHGWQDLVKPIMNKGADYFDNFWRYAVGRAARELKNQHELPDGKIVKSTARQRKIGETREKLFEENEIQSLEALKNENYEKVYNDLRDFRTRTADFMEQMGVINAKQREGWMRKEFLFSFWRDIQLGRQGLGRTTDTLAAESGIYKIHGSTQNLRDPFQSFMRGIEQQVKAGIMNRSKLELVDIGRAAHQVPGWSEPIDPSKPLSTRGRHFGPNPKGVAGAGVFFREIDATSEIVTVGRRNLIAAYKKEIKQRFGLKSEEAEAAAEWVDATPQGIDQLAVFMGQGKPFGSNIMTVMRDGKPEYYEINDPMLIRTMESMSRPAQTQIVQQWGKLKQLKQKFIVVEPSFMVANFVRDVAMATLMSRTGNQHLTAALNGLRHIYKQDKTYQDFIANGGGGSTMRDNLNITKSRLSKHKGGPMNPQNMVVTFSDVVRGMEIIGRGLENASRVGEYARGRAKGMTAQHSAFLAREVSTDFSMRGASQGALGFANTTIPFFSAMLAGADRGYRAMFRDPTGKAKTVVKIGMVGTASAVLYGLNKQLAASFGDLEDEDGRQQVDFNNLPQWSKTAYWHWYIPTEFSPSTGAPTSFTHLHMPKLWEVGALATWAELFVESMQNGDGDDRSLAKDFLQVAAGNFNINLIEEGMMLPLPVGVDLAVEQTANKILFTGSPIETAGMENLQPWQRARSGQSRAIKKWGELFKGELGDYTPAFIKSPARAEALLRGITSNWGAMALQVIDSAVFPGGPSLGLDDYPVFRRVYSEAGKYDRNVSGFYENLRNFNQAYGTIRQMAKQGDIEALEEMSLDEDQMKMVGLSPGFDKMNRTIQLMNREISLIRDGAVMTHSSGREKHAAINRIEAMRNDVMKQMNLLSHHYRKRG